MIPRPTSRHFSSDERERTAGPFLHALLVVACGVRVMEIVLPRDLSPKRQNGYLAQTNTREHPERSITGVAHYRCIILEERKKASLPFMTGMATHTRVRTYAEGSQPKSASEEREQWENRLLDRLSARARSISLSLLFAFRVTEARCGATGSENESHASGCRG